MLGIFGFIIDLPRILFLLSLEINVINRYASIMSEESCIILIFVTVD